MKIKPINNSLALWLSNFPWKKKNDHKYSRGKLIVIGGQINMTGATILSAESALRVGIGSVKIICSKKTLPIYSLRFPSALKEVINNLSSLKKLIIKEKNSIFLIGPGLIAEDIVKNIPNTLRKLKKTN